jgi:signal transduction histidine kinase
MGIGTLTTVLACWHFLRHPTASHLMLALGCLGCAALSFIDNWMFFLSGNPMGYEHIAVTSYMGVSLVFGISAAAFLRADRAIKLEAVHKTELEREVQAQRQELQALHEREQTRAREQAIADERARLMQDMHDGLGSRLVGLMSTVQSGEFTREELTQDLGEAMDELRLTLDSLSPANEDLASLLGQLRFRLAPRWRKLGIQLDWQVHELPPSSGLGPSELASLQRLLHEVFSNVLKHARASRVQVKAFMDQARARHVIEISDDGIGFDPMRAAGGHGLSNMARRAGQLGGALLIDATPGAGTRIRIELPHHDAGTALNR